MLTCACDYFANCIPTPPPKKSQLRRQENVLQARVASCKKKNASCNRALRCQLQLQLSITIESEGFNSPIAHAPFTCWSTRKRDIPLSRRKLLDVKYAAEGTFPISKHKHCRIENIHSTWKILTLNLFWLCNACICIHFLHLSLIWERTVSSRRRENGVICLRYTYSSTK